MIRKKRIRNDPGNDPGNNKTDEKGPCQIPRQDDKSVSKNALPYREMMPMRAACIGTSRRRVLACPRRREGLNKPAPQQTAGKCREGTEYCKDGSQQTICCQNAIHSRLGR